MRSLFTSPLMIRLCLVLCFLTAPCGNGDLILCLQDSGEISVEVRCDSPRSDCAGKNLGAAGAVTFASAPANPENEDGCGPCVDIRIMSNNAVLHQDDAISVSSAHKEIQPVITPSKLPFTYALGRPEIPLSKQSSCKDLALLGIASTVLLI